MCKNCDWPAFVVQANDLIEDAEGIPPKGASFAASVIEKVESMRDWATENTHVTERMETSLENMRGGVEKWLD